MDPDLDPDFLKPVSLLPGAFQNVFAFRFFPVPLHLKTSPQEVGNVTYLHMCASRKLIIDLYTPSVLYNHRLIVERENWREKAL